MRCYLIEDLGDITLFSMISPDGHRGNGFNPEIMKLYKNVLSELPRFQVEAGQTVDYSLCNQFNEFGEENMDYDLMYFKVRFLDNYYPEHDSGSLRADFGYLKQKLLEVGRKYFLYRDFQSRNIMVKGGELFFIDYQSGRRGALQYDLASLLYDAKADIPQEIRYELIDHYIHQAKKLTGIDEAEFKYYFWYFAIIRILQALGAYGYLGLTRGKKKFLDSIPYALRNIRYILNNKIEENTLSYLRLVFDETLTLAKSHKETIRQD